MKRIINNIYVGKYDDYNKDALPTIHLGCDHVYSPLNGRLYHWDDLEEQAGEVFEIVSKAESFFLEHYKKGILIHCHAGISRSPSVCFLLCWKAGLIPSYELFKKIYPEWEPNSKLFSIVQLFSTKVEFGIYRLDKPRSYTRKGWFNNKALPFYPPERLLRFLDSSEVLMRGKYPKKEFKHDSDGVPFLEYTLVSMKHPLLGSIQAISVCSIKENFNRLEGIRQANSKLWKIIKLIYDHTSTEVDFFTIAQKVKDFKSVYIERFHYNKSKKKEIKENGEHYSL